MGRSFRLDDFRSNGPGLSSFRLGFRLSSFRLNGCRLNSFRLGFRLSRLRSIGDGSHFGLSSWSRSDFRRNRFTGNFRNRRFSGNFSRSHFTLF